MNYKFFLIILLTIPLTSQAGWFDKLLLKASFTKHLQDEEWIKTIQVTPEKNVTIKTDIDDGDFEIFGVDSLHAIKHNLIDKGTSSNWDNKDLPELEKYIEIFKVITESGTVIYNTRSIDKLILELNTLSTDSRCQNDYAKLKDLHRDFKDIIAQNKYNIRKQKAIGATTLAFITALIGTGIYFGYKKFSSEQDKEEKNSKG